MGVNNDLTLEDIKLESENENKIKDYYNSNPIKEISFSLGKTLED